MNPDIARELFSYICGQDRPFFVDGLPLPLDQRCLGLYLGALLTGFWLFATGIWRRALPPPIILRVDAVLLFAAMLGGLHVIDPGPLSRFAFGLWTGHVAILWLAGARTEFRRMTAPDGAGQPVWRNSDIAQSLIFPLVLAVFAAGFPLLLPAGWQFWTAAASLGVLALGAAAVAACEAALRSIYLGFCHAARAAGSIASNTIEDS